MQTAATASTTRPYQGDPMGAPLMQACFDTLPNFALCGGATTPAIAALLCMVVWW